MRSELFWNITRHRVVFPYRRFETTYRSNLKGLNIPRESLNFLALEDGTEDFFETSVRNYHSALRNVSEECSSEFYRGGSTESTIKTIPLMELLLRALPH
jgi:hypothetical protein